MATELAPIQRRRPEPTASIRVKAWMTAAPPWRSPGTVVLTMASALLVVSAALHLDLWSSGYRSVPTIGWLFLAQGIATPVIAVVLLLTRWLAAVFIALATMVGTLGGFVLAATVGLFGFHDGFAAPFASITFATEISAIVLLIVGGTMAGQRRRKGEESATLSRRVDEIFDSVPASAVGVDECWVVRTAPDSGLPPLR
jgi:hypothetical protein